MNSFAWAAGVAVLATAAAVACGSGSGGNGPNGGGSSLFPFSGPSCVEGPPPGTNDTCGQCEDSACSGPFGCIASACAEYFNCACACPLNDYVDCGNRCPASAACQACVGTVRACTDRAGVGSCLAACPSSGGSGGGSGSD